jgi:hypothetical protein
MLQLPARARLGVYVAFKYYYSLFKKIKTPSTKISAAKPHPNP